MSFHNLYPAVVRPENECDRAKRAEDLDPRRDEDGLFA